MLRSATTALAIRKKDENKLPEKQKRPSPKKAKPLMM
jgi:hypothetical protein